MKPKMLTIGIVAMFALYLTGAVAQHEQHHPDQSGSQTGPQSGMMAPGGMMGGGMQMCGQRMSGGMMARHQEMENLVNQLTDSLKALQTETDPTVLKTKLAEHGALLQQLQTKFQQHSQMMQRMMQQMQQQHMTGPNGSNE